MAPVAWLAMLAFFTGGRGRVGIGFVFKGRGEFVAEVAEDAGGGDEDKDAWEAIALSADKVLGRGFSGVT